MTATTDYFEAFAEPSGVANLERSLTINFVTVAPLFWYNGKDADAVNWDPTDSFGEVLTAKVTV